MIYKKNGSRYCVVKFRSQGELIRKSTSATTYRAGKGIEANGRELSHVHI